jgi:hypothetical protein
MSVKGNLVLAEEAQRALTAPGYETEPGYCQRFTRQVVQKVYGGKFDKYFKSSAYETMLAFKDSPYAVPVERGSLPGDLLYKGRKTSGTHGHVGIRILGNKVAENSSAHVREMGDRDARGTRSLEAFGEFELIVRLPIIEG